MDNWEQGILKTETSLPVGMLLPNKPKHGRVLRQATKKDKSDSQGLQGSFPAERPRKKPLGRKSLPLSRNSPVNSGVDGAILSRKEKPTRQASRPIHFRFPSAHAQLRLLPLLRVEGPGCGAAGPRPPSLERAESALPRGGVCPVLTLAAEPGLVRGCCRLHCPVVGFLLLVPARARSPTARRPSLLGTPWSAAAGDLVLQRSASRPSGRRRRCYREPSLLAAREQRASESEGFLGQVAPRRWSPSRGSVWPTRSTARTLRSAETLPRPREMPPKKRRR